jgi:hypothetical protein
VQGVDDDATAGAGGDGRGVLDPLDSGVAGSLEERSNAEWAGDLDQLGKGVVGAL